MILLKSTSNLPEPVEPEMPETAPGERLSIVTVALPVSLPDLLFEPVQSVIVPVTV